MKNLTKMLLGAASIASVVSIAAPAIAQDAPEFSLSGYATVTSDYRFRGISQSDRDFAPQGSLNLSTADGWYVGAWASTVDFDPTNSGNPHVEVDIYGGKKTDLGFAEWNIQPYYYAYPSADVPAGAPSPDYFELINQLSHTFGPVSVTATYAWSPELPFAGGEGNYLGGTAAIPINDWLSISGNVGHQWAENAKLVGSRDYTWGDIGVTASYMGFALDLRYSGTDLNRAQCAAFYMATTNACAGGFVGSLTYTVNLLP
jgi:uncharacterized protein (TIGR02001 family)